MPRLPAPPPAVLTTSEPPEKLPVELNTMPEGLTSQTLTPVALMLPSISEVLDPVTRLSTVGAASDEAKVSCLPAPTLKLSQLMIVALSFSVTVSALALVVVTALFDETAVPAPRL